MNGLLVRFASRRHVRVALLLAVALASGALLNILDVHPAASQSLPLSSLAVQDDPGLDPGARAWSRASALDVPLSVQNLIYPLVKRPNGPASVTLRAINTRTTLYVRVEWADPTRDDRLQTLTDFTDAVAVEFPTQANVSTPAICMGVAGGGVNIWQWRAVLQGGDGLQWRAAHPDMYVDDDPWQHVQPDLAFPARNVGNPVSGAFTGPVNDLTAQAFGTLAPTAGQLTRGIGQWANGRWSVVFARDLTTTADDEAALGGGVTTDMAVAVWDGSQGDRNGQKVVSQFITLSIPATFTVRSTKVADALPFIGLAVLVIAAAGGVLWWEARGTGAK